MPPAHAASAQLIKVSKQVTPSLRKLTFSAPVAYVYNPLDYAWSAHEKFLRKYGGGSKRYLLLGMNPGPFGMAQTGVPFGEIDAVRNYLGIKARVGKPNPENPKRPITGFECTRSEVSGRRLWSWCEQRFGSATQFFKRFYVHNYCPLVFMEEGGRNVTPDKLPVGERTPLFEICNHFLRQVVELQRPEMIIGVGAFAEARARKTLADCDLRFGRLPHPSPASPLANRGWDKIADQAIDELGIS